MNLIRTKLNSNAGMSILAALLGFLVAAMVSMVIVTAAISSARSVADDRDATQAQLTLSSAAQLIEAEAERAGYTMTERVLPDGTDAEGYPKYEPDPDSGSLENAILSAVKAVDGAGKSFSSDLAGTFSVTVDGLEDVSVSWAMQADNSGTPGQYGLKFTLTGAESGNVLYLLMERKQTGTSTRDDGGWVITDNGTTSTRSYVLNYTETVSSYSWKLIGISSVDASASH